MVRMPASSAVPFFVAAEDPPSKREILKAGLALFAERGVDSVSVRDIAERAGYTNPALFKFFASKDELVEHLFVECYRELSRRFAASVRTDGSFRLNLRALLEEYADVVDHELDAFLFVTDNLRRLWPRVSGRLRGTSMLRIVQRLVERGRADGDLPVTLETKLLVAGIVGVLSQVARMVYFGEFTGEAAERVDALESLILKMCR